jgi:DDE superfamily endonuclease
MTKEAYKQGRIRYFQQDGNREFISLLACICADGTALPPALIYQGVSNDLQSTWIDDLNEQEKAYFTSSVNGWTCNELGLAWLRRFHEDTRHKGNRRRLLILDGYLSHINMAFIALADSLGILILVLPPYITHRLQPLDVGLFSPLAKAYTKRLNAYTYGGLGWVSMTKRLFWPLFRDAWEASFTTKNIKKAFEKTGIWPVQPSVTINQLQKASSAPSTPSRLPPLSIATPLTVRGIRRLVKSSSSRQKEALLERAVLRLATKLDIQSFENRGLRMAITQEKKRRQRGKRLNLLEEEEAGVP